MEQQKPVPVPTSSCAPAPYLGVNPLGAGSSVFHPAVEVHGQHVLGTGFFPGIAVPEPVVGFFHLPKGARAVPGPPSPGDLPRLCHIGGWPGKAPAARWQMGCFGVCLP